MNLIYNGPYGDKYTYILLNNAGGSQISLPATAAWKTVPAGQVLLNRGADTIETQSNWGWYLIDDITLAPSAPRSPHNISTIPVNKDANQDAKPLLKYLERVYEKNILSGQQDQASSDLVTNNTSISPATFGVDFMDYTVSRASRGASSIDTDRAIAHAAKGGIVTFAWHWGAPVGLYDTPEQRCWSAL